MISSQRDVSTRKQIRTLVEVNTVETSNAIETLSDYNILNEERPTSASVQLPKDAGNTENMFSRSQATSMV